MGTVNWDYWLEELVLAVPGAERPILNHQVRAAAIEFCGLSEAWRMDNLPVDIETNQSDYVIAPPISGTEIVKIVAIKFDGDQLDPVSKSDFTRGRKSVSLEYANVVTVNPIPDAPIVGGLACRSAVRPSRIAQGMDEEVGKRYFDAILCGAKAKLFAMHKKPWTDPNDAVFQHNKMVAPADKARTDVNTSHGRIAHRTRPVFIGGI